RDTLDSATATNCMSYVVLARKWRPTRFEDLVGQEHVARTLANAIASGRIAHAFLFTGVRGVGKTTSARLLARALNCMGNEPRPEGAPDPGPTASPCLQCPACREITQGSDVDVREIDGASYNGVDEVRKLQDSLPYRPTRDRYKIFIIDEVHMLSQSAWNAFLKTLEEPPPHVKFIFATTEVHKVPVTILSRVQRFDFKMIPTRLIVDRLRFVLEAEHVKADDIGLSVIARQAAGSMRDAMSLLDQVIAWNDQQLDGDSVARVLGVASRRILHELAATVVDGKTTESLTVIDRVCQQGFDLAHVARDFLELLRDLVVSKLCPGARELLDLPDEELRDVQALAARADADDLLRLYNGFSAGFDDILRGAQPRGAFEMLLLRLCRRPPLIPLDELVARLGTLERRLGATGATTTTPGATTANPNAIRRPAQPQPHQAPPTSPPGEARPRPREEHGANRQTPDVAPTPARSSNSTEAEPDPEPDGGSADARQVTAALPVEAQRIPPMAVPVETPPNSPPAVSPVLDQESKLAEQLSVPGKAPAMPAEMTRIAPTAQPVVPQRSSTPATPIEVKRVAPPAGPPAAQRNPARAPGPQPSAGSRPSSAPGSARRPAEPVIVPEPEPSLPTEADIMAIWQELVESVMQTRPDVSAMLEHAVPVEFAADRLVLGWPPGSVFAQQLEDSTLIDLILSAQPARGNPLKTVSIRHDDPRAVGRETLAARETAERTRRYRQDQARIRNHPRVKDVLELLGGRIAAVKLADH
ncbi:MAG TPA: DNA polymerase III subunit gamma/tau, partial [Polyangiaceae bacterium]